MTNLERRVLTRAIAAHPERLSTDQLARWIKESKDDVRAAVHSLQRLAMLVPGDSVAPTRAALSYGSIVRAR